MPQRSVAGAVGLVLAFVVVGFAGSGTAIASVQRPQFQLLSEPYYRCVRLPASAEPAPVPQKPRALACR